MRRDPFKKLRRDVRDVFGYLFLRLSIIIFKHINIHNILPFGKSLGSLAYPFIRKDKQRSFEDMRIAFGNTKSFQELDQIARASFQNMGMCAVECIAYNGLSDRLKSDFVKIHGEDHLKQALSKGHGVIVFTAHFGNFTIMGPRLADNGYKVNIVIKDTAEKRISKLAQQTRIKMGINTIFFKPQIKCTKACIEALKKNQVLILLADQNYKKGGVFVDFFGKPAATAAGPAFLAISSGAPVLPMFMLRNKNDTHSLIIDEPVEIIRTNRKKHDIEHNMQKMTNIIESYVSRYPDLWAWNQRRWRRQPDLSI